MFRVMNRITHAQWVFGCSFGLVFGLVLFGLIELDPFDRPVSPPEQKILHLFWRGRWDRALQ